MPLLLACAAGIYIGFNFNVLTLLPFSMVAAGALFFLSWSSGQNFLGHADALFIPLVSIQAGYMIGLTAREAYGHLLARLNIS